MMESGRLFRVSPTRAKPVYAGGDGAIPAKGVYTIGFVTNEHIDEAGKKLVNVFVPNSPNPMTGFLHIFDDVDVIRTSITIEEGLKMVVSAGRMSPKDVGDKMVQAKNDDTEKTKQAESQ